MHHEGNLYCFDSECAVFKTCTVLQVFKALVQSIEDVYVSLQSWKRPTLSVIFSNSVNVAMTILPGEMRSTHSMFVVFKK